MKKVLLSAVIMVLAGCKLEMEAPILMSKIGSGETFDVSIGLEVPACNDYEDSRKPSKSLLDLQEKVKSNLPFLTYKECYRKSADSFAGYTMKGMYINESALDKHKNDSSVLLVSHVNNGETSLSLVVPVPVKEKLTQLAKDNYVDFRPIISFDLKNDTDIPITISGTYTYVNDHPSGVSFEGKNLPGNSNKLTFSNVMADYAVSRPSEITITPFISLKPASGGK